MRRLIIISGAGLSAESGIPTFRSGSTAMWENFSIDEVCNIHTFAKNYYKVHDFYNARRVALGSVDPNLAHLRIAEWYSRWSGRVINLTTNVDDLLERAGVKHEDILHVHGYLPEIVYEDDEGNDVIKDIGYSEVDASEYTWVKPNVVFFGEVAPKYVDMYDLLTSLTSNDMVILVGCSNTVINFNWELFPACNKGTKLLIVNKYDSQHLGENGISRSDIYQYEDRGIPVWFNGAVDAFSDKTFIDIVENFMEL